MAARVIFTDSSVRILLVSGSHNAARGRIAFEAGARAAGRGDGVAGVVATVVFGAAAIALVGLSEFV